MREVGSIATVGTDLGTASLTGYSANQARIAKPTQ